MGSSGSKVSLKAQQAIEQIVKAYPDYQEELHACIKQSWEDDALRKMAQKQGIVTKADMASTHGSASVVLASSPSPSSSSSAASSSSSSSSSPTPASPSFSSFPSSTLSPAQVVVRDKLVSDFTLPTGRFYQSFIPPLTRWAAHHKLIANSAEMDAALRHALESSVTGMWKEIGLSSSLLTSRSVRRDMEAKEEQVQKEIANLWDTLEITF